MPSSNEAQRLLLQNQSWSKQQVSRDPEFFKRLSETQSPKFLWIGCSDSRVPADAITGTQPGQIFVHRNIANMVVHTDLNLLSVLEYAVVHLKVEHIIVCGHHGCGGVKAAMTNKDFGILNHWLRNIKEVYATHQAEVDALPEGKDREDRLVELSAAAQARNLARTSVIQKAWKERGAPFLHAWVYDLSDGILKEEALISPTDPIEAPWALNG